MNPFRSLTARGRIFLCVGLVIVVGALAVGERDLLRIGVFVVLLPVVCALVMVRVPRGVTHTRELSPARIPVGGDCRVALTVVNTGRTTSPGSVLVEDRLPYALGDPPRFALGRLRPGERRTVTYRLRSHMRGRYPVGPLTLHFVDPLGCARFTREVGTGATLLVTPAVVDLAGAVPRGDSAESGESRLRVSASAGDDDAVPRAYRHGDGMRRVHWRSTARRGQLMVRREEQQWRDHSSILLDVRSVAHAGQGTDSSLETAITLAASIAVHLLKRGQELRFMAGKTEISPLHRGDQVLDALAVLQTEPGTSLKEGTALVGQSTISGRGLLVAVVGALRTDEARTLAACHGERGNGRVVVFTPGAAWAAPEAADRAREHLVQAGWRVLEPSSADELGALWSGLAAGVR
ncbi:DUF58 domain-containing protein [Nocardiopsis ansamitocini]|uniref:Membrane protein n=1 Tax=Nocardiopsis ansamitocini TaxID=1670832 RepID=A0A9W6P2L2_9ACTN|nr:DUF58 domain-containing protein [Nocardiopsis ansamitocini]GLU45986.1 membrane protein [Nocardiopsis ansamitocini]